MPRKVTLTHTTQTITICPAGEPTRLASMQTNGWVGTNPYPRADVLTFKPVKRKYKALVIENRYLRATVIPELGAHLYSLHDKISGEECFVKPDVLQYGRVHLRGAWYPLGVEFNFPRGHTVNSSWPVQWASRENEDGSATICLAAYHWVTRMHWQVNMTLRPDDGRLHMHTRLANPTDTPRGFMYWANAAVWMSSDFRMQVRATMADIGDDIVPFPVRKGLDWTWYRNRIHSSDLFAIAPGETWFGGYDHGRQHGVVHVSDPKVMPGKKFFTWGNSADGQIWTKLFGMNGKHYGEIQAGLDDNQVVVNRLDADTAIAFDEIWYPIRQFGDVMLASEDLAAAVVTAPAKPVRAELRLLSPVSRPDARVEITSGGKKVLAKAVNLSAGQVASLALPAFPEACPMHLVVRQGKRVVLAGDLARPTQANEQERDAYEKARLAKRRTDTIGKAASLLDLHAPEADIAPLIKQATRQKQDPAEIAAEYANLCMRTLEHDKAWKQLQAVAPAKRDARWQRAAGDLLTRLGKLADAAKAYQAAAKAKDRRPAALMGLARCQAALGKPAAALTTAKRALNDASDDPSAQLLHSRLLRLTGDQQAALDALVTLEAMAPAMPGLNIERWLMAPDGPAGRALWKSIVAQSVDDADWFLEAAWELAHLGAVDDAIEVTAAAVNDTSLSDTPMQMLTLAWWLRDQDADAANTLLDAAAAMDWALGRPHRWESVAVLDWAAKQRPDSGCIHYWLGCLAQRAKDEGASRKAWLKAIEVEPKLAGAHRNLGHQLFYSERRSEEAWDHYKIALANDRHDPHLIEEAQYVLCHQGRLKERLALLRKATERDPECDKVVRLLVCALCDLGRYAEAIEVMRSTTFSPWEGERTLKMRYAEATTALARLALRKGDFDLATHWYEQALDLPETLGHARSHIGNDAHVLYGLGLVAWSKGELSKADDLWEQAANRRFLKIWVGHQYNTVEMLGVVLACQRIGRYADAKDQAEMMVGSADENRSKRKNRRSRSLRGETWGSDPYRWPLAAGIANMTMGRKPEAMEQFKLVLDSYGPHDGTVGRMAMIDKAGKWPNLGAYEIDWVGLKL